MDYHTVPPLRTCYSRAVAFRLSQSLVSELYFVLPIDDWVADLDGSLAVLAWAAAGTPSLECVHRGRGCVAARLGEIVVVGVYLSPNRTLADLHNSLLEMSVFVIGLRSLLVLFLGDFNAKNLIWVSGTRTRGAGWRRSGHLRQAWSSSTGVLCAPV